MNELRMAVIGIKGVGRGHVEAIATDQRAELVALADLDQSAMEVMAALHTIFTGPCAWRRWLPVSNRSK